MKKKSKNTSCSTRIYSDPFLMTFLKKVRSFNISFWNSRAVCAHDPKLRNSKFIFLKTLLNKSDVVCVQEAHDDGIVVKTLLQDEDCHVWTSPGQSDAASGLCICINSKVMK